MKKPQCYHKVFTVTLVIIFCYSLFPFAALAQPGGLNRQKITSFADSFIQEKMKTSHLHGGISLSIVKDGELLYERGYGYANAEKKAPVLPDHTEFYVGSVAKTVTAIAVMQLVEQGKIDLHADITRYAKDVKLKNKYRTPLTMHNLLSYSSGFDETIPPGETVVPDAGGTVPEQISLHNFVTKNVPPVVREPGTAVMYDNYAYNLAGYIVQCITGMPFNDYVRENIFLPLGMHNTSFRATPEIKNNIAAGYTPDGKRLDTYSAIVDQPGGGLISTSHDMAKLMVALLNKGRYGNTQIFTEQSVLMMYEEKFPMTAYGTEAVSYKNKQVIRKGGDIGTFHSTMWLLPKERLGIFITASADVKGIGEFITSFIDTHYPASKADKGQKAYVKTPAEELTQLTGTYRYIRYSETTYGKVINFFRPYAQLKVAAEDGGLLVELMGEHRQFRQITPLVFEERNRETVGNQNRLTFVADKRNNVLYLQMPEEATYFKKVEGYEDITIHKWLAIFFTAAFLILSILLFVQRKRGESSLLRRITLWNCLVHLVFIPIFVVIAMKVMAGASTALLYIPLTLPLLAVPLTALLITLAIKDWSNKGWRGGVRFVPVATCFVSFLFPLFLRYWNLLGY